jgi:thiol:disulfide interchange protein
LGSAKAQPAINAAMSAAKSDGKEVLLDFGATWCGNCVAMEGLLGTADVKATMAASYHLVQINVDDSGSILGKYDTSGSYALPVLLVVSPSGSVRVDTNKTGNPDFYGTGFESFLKKWAA